MLPNAATFMRTVRDTDDPIAQDKPLDIGDRYWMNNPNRNQALSWLNMHALPSKECHNHIFGHLDDTPFANWVEYTGADESSQGTTGLTIDNVYERCAAGQILFNPRTKELMRLTADPASADTTAAVARNHGRGVATDYLKKGDKLLLLHPQMVEGFTTGKAQSGVGVYKSFSTGIFDAPIRATNTEESEDYYAMSSPFERDLDKTWIRFNDQAESGMFFAAEKLDSSSYTQNYHTYSGIHDFIETNVWTVNGTISRLDFLDMLMEWRLFYKGPGAIICSSFFKAMVSEWATGQMMYDQEAKTLGMNIEQINLGGTFYDLIDVDKFSQEYHLMGMCFFCPQGKIRHRPLQNKNGITNDVHYNPISRDEVHSKEGEIWGEFGIELFQEETWGVVEGLEF